MERDDLQAAYSLWLESAGARAADDLPDLEALDRFFRGESTEAEQERVADALTRYPELGRLMTTPFSAPEPDESSGITEDMVDAGWAAFQARVGEVSSAQVGPKPPATAPAEESSAYRPVAGVARFWRPWAVAASLLVAVLASQLFVNHQKKIRLQEELSAPRPNPHREILRPEGSRGAPGQSSLTLDEASRGLLLRLDVVGLPSYPDYRLEIYSFDGGVESLRWSGSGLRRTPEDLVEIWIPAQFWESKRYRLDLSGIDERGEQPLARYSVLGAP